jgi:hypothetical protein
VVAIATSYGLDGQGFGVRGLESSPLHAAAHPASYPMGTDGSLQGGKAAGA